MPALRLTDVHRVVRIAGRENAILRSIDLEIFDGDFLTIEGPSGGGKSTLLNVIGALDRPTSGTYEIGDAAVGQLSEKAIAELRSTTFSFIFQNFHLLERRPAVHSVELGLVYRGVPRSLRRELALKAMTQLGIESLADMPSTLLSGGERQRVAIARALVSRTPVVIADEPTGNLDAANSAVVINMLRLLHAQGRTVVVVTHSAEVARSGTRRLSLSDGILREEAHPRGVPTAKPPANDIGGRSSRLRLSDLVADAIANIRSRPARAAGLIAAVAVGVALTVGTAGIAASATSQVTTRFDEHTSRDVTVDWSPGTLDSLSVEARRSIPQRLEALSGVQRAAVIEKHGQTSLRSGGQRSALPVDAFTGTSNAAQAARMTVTWAPGHDHVLGAGELLVGKTLAVRSQLGALSSAPIVFVDDKPFGVAGIIEDSPRQPDALGGILASSSDAAAFASVSKSSALILTDAGAAQQVATQAPLVVNPYKPGSVSVTSPTDPRSLRSEVESDVQAILLGFTGLTLLAAIVGLGNAMVSAVTERRQEFGLRRAIGARRPHIVALVVMESMSIGVLGGVAGLVLGFAGIVTVTIAQRWQPVFDPVLAPIAVAGGIVVGAIGGVLAAAKASRIQPSEALRY